MKDKSKLSVSVILVLLVSAIMAGVVPVKASPTTIQLLPAPTISHDIGEKFNITINMIGAPEIGLWSTNIEWDSSILNYAGTSEAPGNLDRIWEGPFLSSVASTSFMDEYEGPENITGLACSFLPAGPAASGSGLLGTFELEVVGYGSTGIDITFSDILAPDMTTSITHSVVNTTFTLAPPSPYGPTVDFSWPAGTYYENDNVTFTATSTAGYHINTGFLPVMNYTWDFGDGTGTVVDDVSGTPGADSVVTHNFTAAATRTVNVTVQTADNPGGDPLETASKDKDIIIWALVFSYVDVCTVKDWLGRTTMYRERGDGPGLPGSAFAPGETVTLVTDAVFQGLPVIDLYVGFRATDSKGGLLSSQSAKTEISGRAEVDFRLRQAPLPPFGAYEVNSTARMFEQDFMDTLKFYVGWIIEIESVTADPSSVARPAYGEYTSIAFNVTVTNYDPYDSYMAFITVSAFDSLNQILNTTDMDTAIPSAGTPAPGTAGPSKTTSYILNTGIPYAAWPGTASMKANAYTEDPGVGGTAYCPEVGDNFIIT